MNEEMLLYIKHEQLTIDTGLLKKSMNKFSYKVMKVQGNLKKEVRSQILGLLEISLYCKLFCTNTFLYFEDNFCV